MQDNLNINQKDNNNKDLCYVPSDHGYGKVVKKAHCRVRRLVRQYGHFTRDLLLYVFWYLHKAELLDNSNRKFYLVNPYYRGYLKHYIEMARLVIPNLKVINAINESLPESRKIKDVVKYMKKVKVHGEIREDYFQRNHHFQKTMIDPFRDHIFKKLNFKPKIKKRLLFVPRHDRVKSHHLKPSGKHQRWLEDEGLVNALKDFCEKNDYEFRHWENHAGVPLLEQIKIYSESEIIIGVTGTDFINCYWCNDKQLIIEILPTNYYSGFAPAFYSPDIEEMIKLQKEEKIVGGCPMDYELNKNQKRNWHIIYCDDLDEWFRHTRIRVSPDGKDKIMRLVTGVISGNDRP